MVVLDEKGNFELLYFRILFLKVLQIFAVEPLFIEDQSWKLLIFGDGSLFDFLLD